MNQESDSERGKLQMNTGMGSWKQEENEHERHMISKHHNSIVQNIGTLHSCLIRLPPSSLKLFVVLQSVKFVKISGLVLRAIACMASTSPFFFHSQQWNEFYWLNV
jgi:hypothetical protein